MALSATEILKGPPFAVDADGRLLIATDSSAAIVVTSGPAGAPTTQAAVAMTTASSDVLLANASATYRLIVNGGPDPVTLKFGTGAVTDYAGIYLDGGAATDCIFDNKFYTGLVRGKSLTGTPTLSVLEG